MTKTTILMTSLIAMTFIVLVTTPSAYALVGDIVQTVDASGFIDEDVVFCSIGLSFDGTHLYFDACFDGRIWITDTAPIPTVIDVRDFSAEIPENPNAMAFDTARGVTYVATQFGGIDCEIYEINHQGTLNNLQDDTVSLLFATPVAEVGNCFIDGLAYNQNDPIAGADALYVSGDAQSVMSIYLLDGTLVQTVDTSLIDPGASTTSGLAVGGSNLYLANNGGGDVFRATLPSLTLLDQFVSADERQEDMECDPVTFAPTEVMWLRTTPQGGNFPNVATAFEIEPDTCGLGGGEPADPRTIGFWKNHPDDTFSNLPKTIGELEVTDFATAELVFNVNAKNAHDMLAAQLLAAKLNVMNGVPSCDEVDDAISEAQSELAGAGYDEPGSTTAPKKDAKNAVNEIKDVLDDFNNNGCS